MPPPKVLDGHVRFTLAVADPAITGVQLDCDRAIVGARAFSRIDGGWGLRLPRPDVQRLEYRFTVERDDAGPVTVNDPDNALTVQTAFGSRSVLEMPGYAAPLWLDAPAVPGTVREVQVRGETAESVPVSVWSPDGLPDAEPAPLLIVQDGPEYERLASLTHYCGAMIQAGVLPAHRVAMAQPVERNAWYSASPAYVRTVVRVGLPQLREMYAVREPVVAMGASLGGLTALLAGLVGAPEIGGVFAQSGSFFQTRHDAMEKSFAYFDRISRVVGGILHTPASDHPLRVAMTCGALEENARNNADMAAALERAGHTVTYREVGDLHNYTAWRDALSPSLTELLRDCWQNAQG